MEDIWERESQGMVKEKNRATAQQANKIIDQPGPSSGGEWEERESWAPSGGYSVALTMRTLLYPTISRLLLQVIWGTLGSSL